MQCEVTAAGLARLLSAVKPAVAGRTTLDALKCVRLEVADGALSATATDAELCATARVPVSSAPAVPGVALVNHERLTGAVRQAPEGWLRLRVSDRELVLKGAGVRWELPTRSPAEFPVHPEEGQGAATATLPGSVLALVLRRTMFAVLGPNQEGQKGALTGVLLTLSDGTLTGVGSDGKRCSVTSVPVGSVAGGPRTVLVPVRACQAFLGLLDGCEAALSLGNQFRVTGEAGSLVCATLHHSGKVDYVELMAREAKRATTHFRVLPHDLLALAGRALPVGTEELTRLNLALADAVLTGDAKTTAGAVRAECPVERVSGPDAAFALQPDFLRDLARAAAAEDAGPIDLRNAPGRPLVCELGDGFRHLIACMVDA